jgi:hypothetical protein
MPRHATRNPPRYVVESDYSYDRPHAVVNVQTGEQVGRRYATKQKAVDLAEAENASAARPRRESFMYAYMPNGRKSARNGCGCGKRPSSRASYRNPSDATELTLRDNATKRAILRKIKAFGEFYGATVKPLRGGGVRVTLTVENDRSGEFERWSDVGHGRTSAEAIDDALEGILSQL